jgi:uroporphyrinogen decarboxylase
MTRRDCFFNTLNYQPGRIPVDFMADRLVISRLLNDFGIRTERELLDAVDSDFYYLSGRDLSQNESLHKCYRGKTSRIMGDRRICPLGIEWQRGAYDSKFNVDEAITGPLRNAATAKDVLNFAWPVPADFDFSALEPECAEFADRIRIGGLWTGIMGDSYRMFGFENFLLNTAMEPDLVHAIVDRITEMYLQLNDKYFAQLKGKIDVWFFGNDFGSQQSMIISPDMWYDFFFDNIKRLVALAKSYRLRVMMHSCGAIAPIIPYLIDAGIDVVDPIQTTARGMDPDFLARSFGGRIVFHGGIDTQNVLPKGQPEDVIAHVDQIVGKLSRGNGYIFSSSQILSPDISVLNIRTMYQRIAAINQDRSILASASQKV